MFRSCALAAARETQPSGFHLENLVETDLAVWKDGAAGRALYHWRLGSGQEVDFVLELTGRLLPVEVKAASEITTGDARHLRKFRELHNNAVRGVLLSCDPTVRQLGMDTIVTPWWLCCK
jgi:predicted AAA+ superfamily ATPase